MNIGEKFYCSRCMREMEDEGICPYCGYDPDQPVDRSALEEGNLLHDDRYQLGAVIGMGGFGITYAAWDYTLAQPVAIKEYFLQGICERDVYHSNEVMVGSKMEDLFLTGQLRFSREARVLSTLKDVRNVVSVLDWFEDNNTAYIVMEYVRGETLETYVHDHQVEPQQLIAMMQELIDSLILIHEQGIIHRDISPSNIMVQENGTLKLIDFGAATSEERKAQGKDQTVIFNRRFAPIEQYDEAGEQGPWTDVYALSATLYYLISGDYPPEAALRKGKDSLRALSSRKIRLKKWQEKAIMGGLALRADKRIRSMEIYRSTLYHLPMPEEVKHRRRLVIGAAAAVAISSLFSILVTINFTRGFYLGDGVRYSLRGDGFHIVGCREKESILLLPGRRLGIPVVQIDTGAFQGNEELLDVVIPGTVRNVENFAFNDCENLITATLLEGVEKLGAQAFGSCDSMQAVLVPNSLASMDGETFSNPSDRLVLVGDLDSKAAELAGEQGFSFAHIETRKNEDGVTLVKYETLQENARVPDVIDGKAITEIGSGEEKTAVFPSNVLEVRLPRLLKRIGDYAFYRVQVGEVDFPDTLESIGKGAFSQSFLEKAVLPSAVTEVGESAFSVCTRLESISLSESMTKISDGCFENDIKLKQVEIPKGITEIGMLAFDQCTALENLKLPLGLLNVSHHAFMDCVSLETVYLPSSLTQLDPSAFNGCPNSLVIIGMEDTCASDFAERYGYEFYSMEDYDLNLMVSSIGNLIVDEDIEESDTIELPTYFREIPVTRVLEAKALKSRHVRLPEQVESVATSSFYANEYLESIWCPPTLRSIGSCTFENCRKLSKVELQDGLEEIGGVAFAYCPLITDIYLSDSVRLIDTAAFEGCTGLTQIRIPASLVILENDVFAGTGLTSVTVPGNVVKCRTAFYGCDRLEEVIMEEGVRHLWGAFAECRNLKRVVLPASVRQISRSTFLNCESLQDVWIYSRDAELDFVWPAVQHVDYQGIENGDIVFERQYLERDESKYLFSDSPQVTIHGYPGSTAEQYAARHGLNFVEIEEEET